MQDFQPMKHLSIEELSLPTGTDLLKEMFKRQQALFQAYPYATGMTSEELTELYAHAIASEAQELLNQTNWKKWKATKIEFDPTETAYEYIDILHFVINGLIAIGYGPEKCMQIYLAKNKENISRQERGY